MSAVYLFFIIGVVIGYMNLPGQKLCQKAGSLINNVMFLLMFFMGVRIGFSRELMSSFLLVGFKSAVLGLSTIIGSIVAVKIYEKFVVRRINAGKKAREPN